jgi:hypothetical protein
MVKMIDNNEERYICQWCTEWEMVEVPTLQECLNCEEMVQEEMNVPSAGQQTT